MLKIAFDRIQEAIGSDDSVGFCLTCGEDAYGVEPDACKYLCEDCGARAVYGAQQIVMMDQVNTDE